MKKEHLMAEIMRLSKEGIKNLDPVHCAAMKVGAEAALLTLHNKGFLNERGFKAYLHSQAEESEE